MGLTEIASIVILIGSVVVAVTNIIKFFAKPTSFFKRKIQEEYSETLKKNLDELIPKYLDKHDIETKQKMVNEVSMEVQRDLEEIKEINKKQNEVIDLLRKNVLDVLRQKIENIYYTYKVEKKLPQYVRENLEELYKDYTSGGGNHHISKLYQRMIEWEITDELPDYEKE